MNNTDGAKSFFTWFVGANLIGLLLLSIWFRCRSLDNIPGLNGDEAWYGVQAERAAGGSPISWQTPTGNLLNPFFIGPMIVPHLWSVPSIALLRSLAVASGLLALVLNWLLCRWVFGRRMAWISTAMLAVLPTDIAYSRLAWDAAQSLAVTLVVTYFALAAIRFQRWRWRLITAAIACLAAAVIVHPTNIFAAAIIVVAAASQGKSADLRSSVAGLRKRPFALVAILTVVALAGLWIAWLMQTPLPQWLASRLRQSSDSSNALGLSVLFPRLFTGGTIYRYVAGSHSWFQWPAPLSNEGFGVDVVVFWLLILSAAIVLWRSWKSAGREEDGVLVAAWMLTLAAFLVVAGPGALIPGQERFAICLIAPTVILLSRAATLVMERKTWPARVAILTALLAGWAMLADFHTHYFRFIEQTGGQAHQTFRTAAEEPKAAALKYILHHRKSGETWIVAGEWWNLWPLRYLAFKEKDLYVLTPEEAQKAGGQYVAAKDEGRLWSVEFSSAEISRQTAKKPAKEDMSRHTIKDYAGRPILTISHP